MSAFPSAPFPEYGSCGSNSQSHSFPYHQQPQSHNYGPSYTTHQPSHSLQQCGGSHFGHPPPPPPLSNMNMASAPPPNAVPPYPPPYSQYPANCPGGLPGPTGPIVTGPYQPQMQYPYQQPAGWFQGPQMGQQPQVVHVVTTEPPRNVSFLSLILPTIGSD